MRVRIAEFAWVWKEAIYPCSFPNTLQGNLLFQLNLSALSRSVEHLPGRQKKACLGSLHAHTTMPFDLLVFDNASCEEVREYLSAEHAAGRIRYLTLSEENLGKAEGAFETGR